MYDLDTINRGNYIKSFEFKDTNDFWEEEYELLDFEEDEIEYE